jgi:hypothetical protein
VGFTRTTEPSVSITLSGIEYEGDPSLNCFVDNLIVRVLKPDGTVLHTANLSQCGGAIANVGLPDPGGYTIVTDLPRAWAGSLTLAVRTP